MLNKAERFKVLKLIGSCCTIGCFPAVVDLSSWQLLHHSRRRWPSFIYFGLFLLHAAYKVATLFSSCVSQTKPPLHQLIIHAVLSLIGAPFIIFWYYQLFFTHPGAFNIFLGMTLTGDIGGMMVEVGETSNFVSRLKVYTLQDLIAVNLPYMVAAVVVAIVGTGIYCPTLPLLLYAGLPEQYQTWLYFVILQLEEIRYILIFCSVALPVWTLQMISFDLVNNQLKALIASTGRTTARHASLERTHRSLRHIQLYITVINVVNRYLIFSWKIVCIVMCIGTGYAAIAHFTDYPIFGVMYYLILFDGMFIYTVSYGQAFRIPGLFKDVAQLAILRLRQRGRPDVHILTKQMRSIPRVGIKVGEFHVLERESTPVFVHYVLSNIVTMLVAYKN